MRTVFAIAEPRLISNSRRAAWTFFANQNGWFCIFWGLQSMTWADYLSCVLPSRQRRIRKTRGTVLVPIPWRCATWTSGWLVMSMPFRLATWICLTMQSSWRSRNFSNWKPSPRWKRAPQRSFVKVNKYICFFFLLHLLQGVGCHFGFWVRSSLFEGGWQFPFFSVKKWTFFFSAGFFRLFFFFLSNYRWPPFLLSHLRHNAAVLN